MHGRQELSAELDVIFVDDVRIQELNKQFLGRDRPTDVIAFDLSDSPEKLEGEIYVSVDTAQRQAHEYGVTFWNELCRLAVHGVLHLLGFDDATDAQKRRMTEQEDRILGVLTYGFREENDQTASQRNRRR